MVVHEGPVERVEVDETVDEPAYIQGTYILDA